MKVFENIKAILIGSAILDLYIEQTNKSFKILPSLNPYYYKLKSNNAQYGGSE